MANLANHRIGYQNSDLPGQTGWLSNCTVLWNIILIKLHVCLAPQTAQVIPKSTISCNIRGQTVWLKLYMIKWLMSCVIKILTELQGQIVRLPSTAIQVNKYQKHSPQFSCCVANARRTTASP
jgi:hypothetical protein